MRKGKIKQTMFGIIHVILLNTSYYILSEILEAGCPVTHDVRNMQTCSLLYKIVRTDLFVVSTMLFGNNF